MTLFYSAATGGFYDDTVHSIIPDDARHITAKKHAALIATQTEGKHITADADGNPVAIDQPPLTTDQALTLLRARRDRLLSACDYTQMQDYPISTETRAAWAAYRQTLRDLPDTVADDPATVTWPEPPGAEA
ncbi:MAG: tail fiber assembly protein [Sphingobium sp.]